MASAEKVTVQEERVVVEEREVIRVELSEREALLLRALGTYVDHAETWEILDAIGDAAGVYSASQATTLLGIVTELADDAEIITYKPVG